MKKHLIGILLLLPCLLWAVGETNGSTHAEPVVSSALPASSSSAMVNEALKQLSGKKLSAKTAALKTLFDNQMMPDQRGAIFSALAERRLLQTAEKHIVIVSPDGTTVTDALTGKPLTMTTDSLKKVRTNNKLRKQAKNYLALLDLSSDAVGKRLSATTNLLTHVKPDSIDVIKSRLNAETDEDVKQLLTDAQAIWHVRYSQDNDTVIAGLKTLSGSLQPAAKNAVVAVLSDDNSDERVKKSASIALDRIQRNVRTYEGIETLFFGLSLGSVLLLAAVGLAITFGVMGVINMAHGEMMMIGAYCTYVLQQLMPNAIGVSLLVAIPVAFIVTAILGVIIEKSIIRFLYGRPLETLLATFGLSLVLQQAVRSIFSPLNRTVVTPGWLAGSIQVNPVLSLTVNRLVIIIFALVLFAVIVWLMKKTSWGLQIRAVSQNRAMARGIGIRSERVNAMTFAIGSGIAGIAGVALSQLTNVGPNMGQAYIIDSFMVVVFGGVGNLMGTLVGALSLGELNKILEPFSGAVLAKVAILVFIIIFIQNKPRGLFPQKGRDVEG